MRIQHEIKIHALLKSEFEREERQSVPSTLFQSKGIHCALQPGTAQWYPFDERKTDTN